METDLFYLFQRYTVEIAVTGSNWGTSSALRYYNAIVTISNNSTRLSMSGSAHGSVDDDAVRHAAVRDALDRVVRIARTIEEAS